MEKQQAEPYAGVAQPVAVPVNEMQPVAPLAPPYAGVAVPVEAVAQESLPLPTMQAFSHPAGSIMHVQLADGRILKVNVPPGTPPGHQIHFPVAAAPPPVMPPPPPVVSQPGVGVASVSAPETVTVNVPPGLGPGSVFRVTLTDGRPLDVTVPHGVPPGAPLTIPVPPRPVDREGRPLAGIKKKPTHPCGAWIGPGDAACCQVCFFIFCC
ncbi:unnamed protein product, partial [Pelagomonas calceolata]